jgi:pimeloyl-ACP methyl ester carboxylesterase
VTRRPVPVDRTRLVALPAGRVFVQDLGESRPDGPPPVVLLHGLLVTSHAFRRVLPALAEDRRAIAIDLPGCGESDRPRPDLADDYSLPWLAAQVVQTLGALDLRQVDLVGHSFGGSVALQLAAAFPERVRRLVLVDPVAYPFDLPLRGRLALLPRVGPLLFENVYRRADLKRYLQRTMSTPELLEETAVDVYWDRLGREGGREAAHAMLRTLSDLRGMEGAIGKVVAPTLVVWGDRDVLLPAGDAERLVDALPNARLFRVAGCGHAVPEERPEALVELVREVTARAGGVPASP